jgi:hypothetical protein
MIRILSLCLALLASQARAETFEIIDAEGFGRPLVARSFTLPDGWRGEGRVAWLKPCSGSSSYEMIYAFAGPDGRTGFRLMPSHQLFWTEVRQAPTQMGLPSFAAQAAAQARADLARVAAETRGTNCHVTPTAETGAILRALVLSRRPEGTTVVRSARSEETWRMLRDQAARTGAASVGGMRSLFDAVEVTLRVPQPGGARIERVELAWYGFESEIASPGGYVQTTRQVFTYPIAMGWAPEAGAEAAFARILSILGTARPGEEWTREVAKFNEKRAEERQRAFEQSQLEAQQRTERLEAQHRQFIEMITQ